MSPIEVASFVLNALQILSGIGWTVRHMVKRWLRHREADVAALDQKAEQAVEEISDYVREEEEKFHHDADSIDHPKEEVTV
jgi:hypothetical protein